jgi:hypothetical protein
MHNTNRYLKFLRVNVKSEGRYKKYRTFRGDCNDPRCLRLQGFDADLDRELVRIRWQRDRLPFDDEISLQCLKAARDHYADYQESCDPGARSRAWSVVALALSWLRQLPARGKQ